MMLFTTPLLFLAEHKFTRKYLIPVLAYISAYSFLPHKELRFILFVNPLLNLCAASGLVNIQYQINEVIKWLINTNDSTESSEGSRKHKRGKEPRPETDPSTIRDTSKFWCLLCVSILVLIIVAANLTCCFIMARVSSYNYPGGKVAMSLGMNEELLSEAQKAVENPKSLGIDTGSDVAIYVNNLAAQSGFSRFLQVNGAYYSKTPKLDQSTFRSQYKLIYLVLEPDEVKVLRKFCPTDEIHSGNYKNCTLPNQSMMTCAIVETVKGLKSVDLRAFIRMAWMVNSYRSFQELMLSDRIYIRTSAALQVVRCVKDP